MDKVPGQGLLNNKVAIVTGGASGIGEGICLEFASQGALVAVADIDGGKAASVAKRIEALGGRTVALEVDVRDHKQISKAAAKTIEALGTIDILVNCAGWNSLKPAYEVTVEEWEKMRSINLDGPWHFCQAVMPEMMKKKSGKIINIGSGSSLRAIPHAAAYAAAKHGLAGLTKALAVDLGPFHINVNCICPASVNTPLLQASTTPAFQQAMANRLPLGRIGEVDDIVKAALFLASQEANWITGVMLPVDGGLMSCSYAQPV